MATPAGQPAPYVGGVVPRETSSSSHLAATSRPHPLFAHRPAKNAPLVAAAVLLITLTLRVPTASVGPVVPAIGTEDRKSTRLNSSHVAISYAVFCLKKKTTTTHGRERTGVTRA